MCFCFCVFNVSFIILTYLTSSCMSMVGSSTTGAGSDLEEFDETFHWPWGILHFAKVGEVLTLKGYVHLRFKKWSYFLCIFFIFWWGWGSWNYRWLCPITWRGIGNPSTAASLSSSPFSVTAAVCNARWSSMRNWMCRQSGVSPRILWMKMSFIILFTLGGPIVTKCLRECSFHA